MGLLGYTERFIGGIATWRCDLVEMIDYMGKDTHNPQLICPANLNAAHDHWLSLKQAKLEKERIKRERERIQAEERRYLENIEKAKNDNEKYQQARSRFFDIEIADRILSLMKRNMSEVAKRMSA